MNENEEKINGNNVESTESELKRVSFSQYSIYLKCPHKWELDYVKDLREKDSTIHTTFGTAIHHAIQTFLQVHFGNIPDINPEDKRPNAQKYYDVFVEKFKEEFQTITTEVHEGDFDNFCKDGKNILTEVLKPANVKQYFSKNEFELIGIEVPLNIKLINNVEFVGFIDVVLKYKGENKYKIIDIKTSGSGWTKYQKESPEKYVQLHLYKHVYSKKFNVNENDIDVEFFIVRRNIDNKYGKTSRIQLYAPPSRFKDIKESINNFVDFLNEGFTPDGNYQTKSFIKNPGYNDKNCKYCIYYKNQCDAKN